MANRVTTARGTTNKAAMVNRMDMVSKAATAVSSRDMVSDEPNRILSG